jgi:hypothetical protein
VEPLRRPADPYREPWPRKVEAPPVMTCEEMRRTTGVEQLMLLLLVAGVIAGVLLGR